MGIRKFKPRQQPEQEQKQRPRGFIGPQLPVDEPLAIYARQSRPFQVENNVESKEFQTEDLKRIAVDEWGWDESKIDLIDADLGLSGQLRIDQRKGMSRLYKGIEDGTYKAVLVSAVNRTFRDRIGIQSGLFIDACIQSDVLIITPTQSFPKIYNLRNWQDLKDFKAALEASASYIPEVIEKMLDYRKRASLKGKYDGRPLAIGYVVDYRKLVDGKPNPNYKRIIPYEPHVKIVRWLFKRFRELGNMRLLLEEIRAREAQTKQPLFPDFAGVDRRPKLMLDRIQNGTRKERQRLEDGTYQIFEVPTDLADGYTVGKVALRSILTNPLYIGRWMLNHYEPYTKPRKIAHTTVLENNHTAIVDLADFMYAYDRLSTISLDGEEQEPVDNRHTRTHRPSIVSVEALLRDVLESAQEKQLIHVVAQTQAYRITDFSGDYSHYVDECRVAELDGIFIERLQQLLPVEQRIDELDRVVARELVGPGKEVSLEDAKFLLPGQSRATLTQKLEEVAAERLQEGVSVDEQVARIQKRLSILDRNLDLDLPQEKLDAYAQEYKQLSFTLKQLQQKQAAIAEAQAALAEAEDLFEQAITDFARMPFEKKRRFVNLAVRRIVYTPVTAHWSRMEIEWAIPPDRIDIGFIWRKNSSNLHWTEQEDELLRAMYPAADRDAILHALPRRSWLGLISRAGVLGVKRTNKKHFTSALPLQMTLEDARFMHEQGIVYDETWPDTYVLWQTLANHQIVLSSGV